MKSLFSSIRLRMFLPILFISILIMLSLRGSGTSQEGALAGLPSFYPDPNPSGRAYIVRIIGSGEVLSKRREWKKFAPASLTKLLTVAVALENIEPSRRVKLSREAKAVEEKKSTAGVGEEFLRDEMIKLVLIGSSNDAAFALAEAVGRIWGGMTFAEQMVIFQNLVSDKVREIGLVNSHFKNPAGLDELDQYSTAEDLARIAEHIWYRHPQIWATSKIIDGAVYSDNFQHYSITNTNDLLKEFPGIMGGKTGLTDKAKGALLLLYPVKPHKIAVIVILGSDDRFGDGREIIRWLESQNGNGN